jgi:hypothetical protein
LIIIVKTLIAFPPSPGPLSPKLFAKIFTNKRMRIQVPGIMGIFSSK